jgi:1-acyl-sn-glycerol-3-phosphate acyltransferase
MDCEFEDIRPYNDDEIPAVLRRLVESPKLLSAIRKEVFPRAPKQIEKFLHYLIKTYFRLKIRPIRTVEQFQHRIMRDMAFDWIAKKTINGLTVSGLENLKSDPHLYVSNHRDIIFDSVLIGYVLVNNGFGIPAIAFGDNLMANEFASDLIRANKAFVVKRGLSRREKLNEAYKLSRYIWDLHQHGESVWIAQREGRAKDGDDRTNPSLITMLYLSQREKGLSFPDFIREIKVVPVAISYEKDPCDVLKAREMQERSENSDFEKKSEGDAKSMYLSLRKHKGRIHVAIGPVLHDGFTKERDVAAGIDQTVHRTYKLWPSNYIAYDELMDSREYASHYTPEQREEFLNRFREEPQDIRRRALAMYAQPLINKRALLTDSR